VHSSLPTYNGIFPVAGGKTTQAANTKAMYGSWFVHLLPYVEQQNLYDQIAADIDRFDNRGTKATAPATGTLVTAATPSTTTPGGTYHPATYTKWTAERVWVPSAGGSSSGNGYTLESGAWVPAQYPDVPGTPFYDSPGAPKTTPGSPAVYDPPGSGPVNGNIGIFSPSNRSVIFNILICPSDPSPGSDARVTRGKVYANTSPWPSTNYLANWNVFSTGDEVAGYSALPGNFERVGAGDGLSNTIMFGEAYAWCDDRGRAAYLAWFTSNDVTSVSRGGVHNFGLTFSLSNTELQSGGATVTTSNANGYPNPTDQLNFGFQIKPMARAKASCPSGSDCCNSLTVQSGHQVLNIAMADGSVRSVGRGVSLETWRRAIQPNDGETLGSDW